MVEFLSILKHPRRIQRLEQSMQRFVAVEVYIEMAVLFENTLRIETPLDIFDPTPVSMLQVAGDCPRVNEKRTQVDLDFCTTVVRSKLLDAISTRFYIAIIRSRPCAVLSNTTGVLTASTRLRTQLTPFLPISILAIFCISRPHYIRAFPT